MTMQIRLLTGRVTEGREAGSSGDVLTVGKDIEHDEATRLLESGQAEPVTNTKQARAEQRG